MRYRAVLFDIGGPLDLDFAWEMAVDSAIASACGLEGIRVDEAMIEEASERAVEAFAPDAYRHMIGTLCGGDPRAIERVWQRVRAMTGNLDVFQLRPGIDDLLRRLRERGLKLGTVANQPETARGRLARVGIDGLFDYHGLSGLTGLRSPAGAPLRRRPRRWACPQQRASWWAIASTTTSRRPRSSAWRPSSCAAAAIAASVRARLPRSPMPSSPTCWNSRR